MGTRRHGGRHLQARPSEMGAGIRRAHMTRAPGPPNAEQIGDFLWLMLLGISACCKDLEASVHDLAGVSSQMTDSRAEQNRQKIKRGTGRLSPAR